MFFFSVLEKMTIEGYDQTAQMHVNVQAAPSLCSLHKSRFCCALAQIQIANSVRVFSARL